MVIGIRGVFRGKGFWGQEKGGGKRWNKKERGNLLRGGHLARRRRL